MKFRPCEHVRSVNVKYALEKARGDTKRLVQVYLYFFFVDKITFRHFFLQIRQSCGGTKQLNKFVSENTVVFLLKIIYFNIRY